ncbi:MerR family transcriptional regulator [Sphingomonas bacterium]|uniref:MerR family transcriptional regulator n=1 Tax=Sphingomonas bacterium TaxID=1895847 RepID=UPI001575C8F4|nr:helix-turn-helix domain-containing protein [Sphingomonas bacterium]
MTGFRIGDLARVTATRVETIRWYEKVGLIAAPARSEANYRLYDRAALNRLSFIRRARALGFSLDQVRSLLALSGDRGRRCGSIDVLAQAHVDEIDRKIADLQALRGELADLLAACGGTTVADCSVVEALAPA